MRQVSPVGDTPLYRACVYPFVLFLAFNLLLALVAGLQWDHPAAPWWQRAPELAVYPLQTLACAAYLWCARRGVAWDWAWRPCLLGALCGLVGIGLWLVPYFAQWVPAEGGFCPEAVFGAGSAATIAEYALRFARAALVVPLVEELFWRGFLMRWCVNRDFPQEVPVGTHSWLGYGVTTLAFMLIHTPQDYAGAVLYGSIAYWLTVKTKRLTPAIAMHAVANLAMGICAVSCDLPHLW